MSSHTYIYEGIGLMSGTSKDGIDLAACRFWKENGQWQHEVLACAEYAYSSSWQERLEQAINLSAAELLLLDVKLGQLMGQHVADFVARHQLKPQFIASHGHTVHHQPAAGFTNQIGNAHEINIASGLPVIADFRQMDVSLGGQGAPLVPIGDQELYSAYDVCINIGGIANLSVALAGQRLAWDVAPANMLLNALARRTGKPFDADGALAASGELLSDLARQLDAFPYYQQEGPRSLGQEEVIDYFMPLINDSSASVPDLLHTVTIHIAQQIGTAINKLAQTQNKKLHILITGGGAWNRFLVEKIGYVCGSNARVTIPGAQTVAFKEAIIFAFLGVLRLNHESNALASVTGARRDSSGGVIYGGPIPLPAT